MIPWGRGGPHPLLQQVCLLLLLILLLQWLRPQLLVVQLQVTLLQRMWPGPGTWHVLQTAGLLNAQRRGSYWKPSQCGEPATSRMRGCGLALQ